MKTAMISQPMKGLTDEEIKITRNKAIEKLKEKGYNIVHTFFTDEWNKEEQEAINKPVFYLAKSISKMSSCNAVYFCNGWENARGCKIEHEIAKAYNIDIFYEEEDDVNGQN